MRGEAVRLKAQLKAAFAEIARLEGIFRLAIEKLETYAVDNLSAESAGKWFEMYLRVRDLGVQIRRGEIRHRTNRSFSYPCRHNTGTKGAVHTGLSIDDLNKIFERLEELNAVKESRMEGWFGRIDALDRDVVGGLDKRLSSCLAKFLELRSAFYGRLELSGEDPFQKLLVLGGAGVSAQNQSLMKISRVCFGPNQCSCEEDAEPWEDFSLAAGEPHVQKRSADGVELNDDEGILDIKRKWGFDAQQLDEDRNADAKALAREAAELGRLRDPEGRAKNFTNGARPALSALDLYQVKCDNRGTKLNDHVKTALSVTTGTLQLDFSLIGFHSADDLQDLAEIFAIPEAMTLPPVRKLDMSDGFFNASAFRALCQLLRVPFLRKNIEQLSLRGIAVPQRADFGALMQVLAGDSDSTLLPFAQLKTLDISYNRLDHECGVAFEIMLASFPRLEDLNLESCFPSPLWTSFSSISEQQTAEARVCAALGETSKRLQRLNFASNSISMGSRWVDVLFTSESTLSKVNLYGMNISEMNSSADSDASAMEVDSEVDDTWDIQQVEELKWSCSNTKYNRKLFDALAAGMQSGFAQLKTLEMKVGATSTFDDGNSKDSRVADTITLIADYGALKSFGLTLLRNSMVMHNLRASVDRLLEVGLHECETLTLQIPQLLLSGDGVYEVLSCIAAPKLRQMTLAIGLCAGGDVESKSRSCFQQNQMQSIRNFVLELHTSVIGQDGVEPSAHSIARQLEASWLALNSPSNNDTKFRNESLKRSFILSDQQKAEKRVYRCHFLVSTL